MIVFLVRGRVTIKIRIRVGVTFNPKKTGLFWRLERLGGGGGP